MANKKEKISSKQFIIVVNGPSCGGKSSVARIIMKRYAGIFNGKSDALKWLISDYRSIVYRDVVHEITFAAIRSALEGKLSVIKEGNIYQPNRLKELAESFNIPFFVANIEAPDEVLDERFQERVEKKKEGNAKIANVDKNRFDELKELYFKTKMESPLEFDSSKQSPEEITDAIVDYLRENLK